MAVRGGPAARYAAALFELADEQKSLDQVASDLRTLRALIAESPDLRRLIRSPGDQEGQIAVGEMLQVGRGDGGRVRVHTG